MVSPAVFGLSRLLLCPDIRRGAQSPDPRLAPKRHRRCEGHRDDRALWEQELFQATLFGWRRCAEAPQFALCRELPVAFKGFGGLLVFIAGGAASDEIMRTCVCCVLCVVCGCVGVWVCGCVGVWVGQGPAARRPSLYECTLTALSLLLLCIFLAFSCVADSVDSAEPVRGSFGQGVRQGPR